MEPDNTKVDNDQNKDLEIKKVQDFIRSETEKHFNSLYESRSRDNRQQDPQPQRNDQDDAKRQLKEFIDPIIKPDIDETRLIASDAKDEARFYRKNPDALELEEQIEQAFDRLVKANRPTSREDIYKYIIGQNYTSDRDRFIDSALSKRQAQLDKASAAADMASGGVSRKEMESGRESFSKLSVEEMEKALEGVLI